MPAALPLKIAFAATALAAMTAGGFTPPAPLAPATCLLGDAQARRAAYVPYDLAQRDYDARTIGVGFGSAAIGAWGSLGDALAVGGKLWLRSTLRDSPRYYAAIQNRYFRTHYFLYAPAGTRATARVNLTAGDLLQIRTAHTDRAGALFAGYVRFAQLDTIAIAQPPLRAYAVATHVPRYYTEPLDRHRDVWAYVVGVLAHTPTLQARLAADSAELFAHALILREAPADVAVAPAIKDVVSLGRVVHASSRVANGAVEIFSLQNLRDCNAAGITP